MPTSFAALAVAMTLAACQRTAGDDKHEPTGDVHRAAAIDAAESGTMAERAPLPTSFQHITGDGYEGWISPRTSDVPYIPTPEHIAALEAHTAEALAAARDAGAVPPEVDVSDYVRKYSGYHHQGKRHIEVEYICPQNRSLARQHVQVAGGYTCFVKAHYTVEDDTLDEWRVNPKK